MSPEGTIERAFQQARDELGIRSAFPADVLEEASRSATRDVGTDASRADRTDIPFVTIDPPGSRDLDQAVHAERDGDGFLLRYAIADVGFFVDRGSAVEREAWLRGLTFYAPDCREPLYPPVLSQGAASLLPGERRPAFLFDFRLDARGALTSWQLSRAIVQSRAQLTYAQLQAQSGPAEVRPTLELVAEAGKLLLAREADRGGVSLPVRDQHVERRAAAALGYALEYEEPSEAEQWNAEVSLLTGHVVATRMVEARVGLLRTMPPFDAAEVAKLRRIARTLGFDWPEGMSYPDFMHRADPRHPRIDVLVRQARRVMHGAEYVAFSGALPEQPMHGALAFTYTHATAPLRRLADRYSLELVASLVAGERPPDDHVQQLAALPAVMNDASRKEGRLERRIVDIAEAWSLRERVGSALAGVVIDEGRGEIEVQVEDPPVRASVKGAADLGARVRLTVERVDVEKGAIHLALASPPSADGLHR